MGRITLSELSKSFSGGNEKGAVRAVSLDIPDGEFLVLVGPSGCGKSTLLRMIAGIEDVSDGLISIDGRDSTYLPPRARDVAMVFQNYALYPHMTVFENMAFGLKLRRIPKGEIRQRVNDVAQTLRLEDLTHSKPGELSGGQRQRVAIGRAMVREPVAFLMDEPLSNLDAKLRVAMRAELSRLHARLGVTTIYVTHDQVEAMTLGQRVAVLRDGTLQQVDTPQALFSTPANIFVAAFIGSPAINLVRASVEGRVLHFAEHHLPLPDRFSIPTQREVIIGIRPTDFELAEHAAPSLPRLTTSIEVVENLGADVHLLFPMEAPRVDAERIGASADVNADGVDDEQLFSDEGRSLFTARVAATRPIAVGDTVELAMNTDHLHFFDADSGLAV
jgi:multiple sugar transport system ATP-binding protein